MAMSNDDLLRAYLLSSLSSGVGLGTVEVTPGGGVLDTPAGDPTFVYGTVTAPAALDAIATITTPSAGLYEVRVVARITTGANASLADNIQIVTSNPIVLMRTILHPAQAATTTFMSNEYVQEFRVTGAQDIVVRALALEAAAVVYAVSLYIRKVAG